jgi:hypothetical protein
VIADVLVDGVSQGAIGSYSFSDVTGNHTINASFVQRLVNVADRGSFTFALEGVRPNPSSGNGLNVVFALPTAFSAHLELVDVSGRRLVRLEVGSLGAGRHTVHLEAGRKLAAGLYWVRLVQGKNQRVVPAVVVE